MLAKLFSGAMEVAPLFLLWGVPYALLSAAQDSLSHVWPRSRWAGWFPDPMGWFGDPSRVWLRRYVARDRARGYLPALRLAPVRAVLVPFWDAWHAAKTLRFLILGALVCQVAGHSPFWALLLWPFLGFTFEAAYTWLRRRSLIP